MIWEEQRQECVSAQRCSLIYAPAEQTDSQGYTAAIAIPVTARTRPHQLSDRLNTHTHTICDCQSHLSRSVFVLWSHSSLNFKKPTGHQLGYTLFQWFTLDILLTTSNFATMSITLIVDCPRLNWVWLSRISWHVVAKLVTFILKLYFSQLLKMSK